MLTRRPAATASSAPGNWATRPGPRTKPSTGLRASSRAPSCSATQPHRPTIAGLPPAWRATCNSPRRDSTFWTAFSRTEQVLRRATSASSGRSTRRSPCRWSRPSRRWLSSTFIWQPQVSMKYVLTLSLPPAATPTACARHERPTSSGFRRWMQTRVSLGSPSHPVAARSAWRRRCGHAPARGPGRPATSSRPRNQPGSAPSRRAALRTSFGSWRASARSLLALSRSASVLSQAGLIVASR